MPKELTRDEFASQINTKFRILREQDRFEAELIEVSEAKIYPKQESFSLFFLMPESFPPAQGTYKFEHDKIGASEIFVVPIEKEADGVVFEAVFNRLFKKV